MAAQASSSGEFIVNTVGNPKNENCKAFELRNRVVTSNTKVSDERKETIKGEKKIGKDVVIEKEGGKNSEGDKSERSC